MEVSTAEQSPGALDSLVDVGPQSLVKTLEAGSIQDVTTPTSHHQLKEGGRAEWGGVEEDLEEFTEIKQNSSVTSIV